MSEFSIPEPSFILFVVEPFKDDADDDDFFSCYGVDESPPFWEVVFPRIFYTVLLYVFFRYEFFRNLNSAERVFFDIVECLSYVFVDFSFLVVAIF